MTNEKRVIKLSPAYDLISTRLLISIKEDHEELVLSINGKKSNIKQKDFEDFAKNIGLSQKSFQFITDKIFAKKEDMFALINNSYISKKLKEKYINLIEERINILTKFN